MKVKEIIKQYKLIVLGIILLLLVVIGSSFAIFNIGIQGGNNKIKVGNLALDLDETASNGILISPAYPLSDEEGLSETPKYIFTLQNNGNITADFTMYLNDITTAVKKMSHNIIRFNLKKQIYNADSTLKENQPSDVMAYLTDITVSGKIVLDSGSLEPSEKITYTLNLWMDYDAGNEYQGSSFKGKLRIDGTQQYIKISNAYRYDEDNANTLCITGNESTCVETDCYKTGKTCSAGDIIDYMVNGTDRVRFHVMYDELGKITMQSQKNTVYNVAWNTSGNNADGPTTILSSLDTATAMWTNSNDVPYILGTTVFKTSAATGCAAYNACAGNTYTLPSRTSKARIITVQEANLLGCTGSGSTCPKWMYNYLATSSASDTHIENSAEGNNGYWTISALSSGSTNAFGINTSGNLDNSNVTTSINYGARAVIQINK